MEVAAASNCTVNNVILGCWIVVCTETVNHLVSLCKSFNFKTMSSMNETNLRTLWTIVSFLAHKCDEIGKSIVTIHIICIFCINMTRLSWWTMMPSCWMTRMLVMRLSINTARELFLASLFRFMKMYIYLKITTHFAYRCSCMGSAEICEVCCCTCDLLSFCDEWYSVVSDGLCWYSTDWFGLSVWVLVCKITT